MSEQETIVEILEQFADYSSRFRVGSTTLKLAEQRILKVIEGKIDKIPNPYPESVFIPPTSEQYKTLHLKLKEVGLTIDKFSADIGRHMLKMVKADIKCILGIEGKE